MHPFSTKQFEAQHRGDRIFSNATDLSEDVCLNHLYTTISSSWKKKKMILFYSPIPFLLSYYPTPTLFHCITFQFEILTGNALLIFKYTNQIVLILASFLAAQLCFCLHIRLQPSPFSSKKNKLCWVMVRFIKIYYLCEGHLPSVMSVTKCYFCPL